MARRQATEDEIEREEAVNKFIEELDEEDVEALSRMIKLWRDGGTISRFFFKLGMYFFGAWFAVVAFGDTLEKMWGWVSRLWK